LLIHSINNNFFEVPSSWRPPSHYIRFRGLLEFLYSKNYLKISNDEEINLENGTLNQIIEKINPKTILVFTSHGNQEPETIQNFSKLLSSYYSASEPIVCLIGGYQYGPAPDRLLSTLKDKKIKVVEITLPGGRLPSWKVLNLALYSIEWDVSF
jgi:rRNA pseudouridine-1189 N-methylase Emg1 (Nep1/Mra1 family)